MSCDCCQDPEGRRFYYDMFLFRVTIRFCSKHLPFFKKCAGTIRERP